MEIIKLFNKLLGKAPHNKEIVDVLGLDKYDLLLDILWVAKKIETTRRLHMTVFLLQEESREIKGILDYTFYNTLMGPYSPKLADDVEDLANGGWIRGDDKVARGKGFGHSYMLSDFGINDFKFHKTAKEKLKDRGVEDKIKEIFKNYNILKEHPYDLIKKIKQKEYNQKEYEEVVRPAEELHLFNW